MFTTSGCTDIGNRKFKFMAPRTQFRYFILVSCKLCSQNIYFQQIHHKNSFSLMYQNLTKIVIIVLLYYPVILKATFKQYNVYSGCCNKTLRKLTY